MQGAVTENESHKFWNLGFGKCCNLSGPQYLHLLKQEFDLANLWDPCQLENSESKKLKHENIGYEMLSGTYI